MIFFYFFKNGRAVFSFDFALGGQEQVWCPLLGCELSAMKISSGFSGLESLGVLTGMLTFFDKHKVETAILDEYMSSKGLEPEEPQPSKTDEFDQQHIRTAHVGLLRQDSSLTERELESQKSQQRRR